MQFSPLNRSVSINIHLAEDTLPVHSLRASFHEELSKEASSDYSSAYPCHVILEEVPVALMIVHWIVMARLHDPAVIAKVKPGEIALDQIRMPSKES